ncbi:MAG: tetratricopeptide repeat protein [Verrucomicrobiota bacterium]|jgi:tetratricopeptide (TPR) repeat protein
MKPPRPRAPAPPEHQEPAPATAPAPGPRRRWFRLGAALLPLLLLGLLELGLRLAGWGYPTSFFLKVRHEGRAVLIENPKFGWRFFPPPVARSPEPVALDPAKPPGTLRIFVFGESAALGDPEPAYGFGRQLERLLQARHSERRIEVVNLAMTAINSHAIREIARDCAPRAGDCWLIYAGNNEVIGPFGAGTVFGRQAPGLASVRACLALQKTRVGQLLARGFKRCGPAQWEGLELFLHQQVRRDDPRLNQVYHHFAKNLSAILDSGKKSGAKVLAATMAVNLKDSPPFASQPRAALSPADQAGWDQCLAREQLAETQGRLADALAACRQAAGIDPDFAELVFRRARCELAQGQAAARADFQLACDLDTLRFRADSRLNEIIRQTAAAKGVKLIDAERELARRSPGGVPGEELFYDHVHLNFSGNYALAALFVPAVEEELFGPAAGATVGKAGETSQPLLTEAEVGRRLGFTDFDRRRVLAEMRLRLQQPPFLSQSNFQERDQRLGQALAAAPSPPKDLVPEYRAALALAPEDWVLRANFGRLLEAAGDASAAAAQWQEVARLLPHEPDAWFQLGNLEHSAGRYAQAARLFQEALNRKPNCAEALNGLGLVLAAQGKSSEAIRQFQAASTSEPRFTPARINLALVLANRGDLAGAAAQYRTVLGLDTNNVGARINLAKLLADQGRAEEAITLYTQALQLAPDNPVAHYDLANALAAQGRHAEAVPHYSAAAQSRPDFAEARYNLGVELARLGKLAEALAQFAEVVRLTPDSAEAHYNYGVALAKEQRYAEAVREFQETLNRQPDNAAARSALERASQLENPRPAPGH